MMNSEIAGNISKNSATINLHTFLDYKIALLKGFNVYSAILHTHTLTHTKKKTEQKSLLWK